MLYEVITISDHTTACGLRSKYHDRTLGSKSQDRETTQSSVELKVLIEQMREQIQNIE